MIKSFKNHFMIKKNKLIQTRQFSLKNFINLQFLGLFVILLSLSSCVETVVVSSVVGAKISIREKTFNDTQKDWLIASRLKTMYLANGLNNFSNSADITVNEGRVLLTGVIREPQKAKLAQELAWKVSDVKEVIDEFQILDKPLRPRDFSSAIIDGLITLELESRMILNEQLKSINYKITTVNRVVYLLGVVEDDGEMQNVLDFVAKTKGVEKVVNHLLLINDVKRRK